MKLGKDIRNVISKYSYRYYLSNISVSSMVEEKLLLTAAQWERLQYNFAVVKEIVNVGCVSYGSSRRSAGGGMRDKFRYIRFLRDNITESGFDNAG